ncbi:YidB family protein [Acinetobacter sichuanensis]|uniref:YidB family protein n=1 Tax=Acinetobacter sichuanensis TaxID=2136183 RepID=UPI00280E7CC5|nr:YidB family protein [Acinetobacter sichuanensis]MDQ9022457.1 YidB family protein [Acinetobacter sichuanensis]
MTNLSNIVEILAKQALGGGQQQSQQGGLGGILGSVLGSLGGQQQQQSQQSGLGGVLGSVLGGLAGGQQQAPQTQQSGFNAQSLLIAVVPLVLAWIQKNGGLQGALDQLKGQGLTSQVDDWVSTGEGANASVNQQQVQNLFDQNDVEQVAQQAQVPTQDVYSAISSVLPEIIDSLTPQAGQTDHNEANNDIQNVLNLVSGFLK